MFPNPSLCSTTGDEKRDDYDALSVLTEPYDQLWRRRTKTETRHLFSVELLVLLADCGSARLIALIDTEESGAGCQEPQQKQERTLGLPLLRALSLCWPGARRRGPSVVCSAEQQLVLMNAQEDKSPALAMQSAAPPRRTGVTQPRLYEHKQAAKSNTSAQCILGKTTA